jgi:hypothetical protein
MPKPTAKQRLADLVLGRPLAEFVAERRANEVAWRRIGREVLDATDGTVEISGETLRAWFCDAETGAA